MPHIDEGQFCHREELRTSSCACVKQQLGFLFTPLFAVPACYICFECCDVIDIGSLNSWTNSLSSITCTTSPSHIILLRIRINTSEKSAGFPRYGVVATNRERSTTRNMPSLLKSRGLTCSMWYCPRYT
jgi:hypothetical protein